MTKTIQSFAMLAVASLAILSACTQKKGEDVTLQVKPNMALLRASKKTV